MAATLNFANQPTHPVYTVNPPYPIYRENGSWWFAKGNGEVYDDCRPYGTIEEAYQAFNTWVSNL